MFVGLWEACTHTRSEGKYIAESEYMSSSGQRSVYFDLKNQYKPGANNLQLIPDNVLAQKQSYLAQILDVLVNPEGCSPLSRR